MMCFVTAGNQCFAKANELPCRKMQIMIKHITSKFNPALFSVEQLSRFIIQLGVGNFTSCLWKLQTPPMVLLHPQKHK